MKLSKNMAYLILITSSINLNAGSFSNFNAMNWNWISVVILSALFIVILVSLFKDIKNKKLQKNNIFNKKRVKNLNQNTYLNEINDTRAKATSDLKKSIKNLSYSNDKTIIEQLSKVYKEIFLTNKEESIFLSIAKDEKIGKLESFRLKSLISKLYEYEIIESKKISNDNEIIVANKEIIIDIFLLLNKLQTKEHNCKKVKFSINLDNNKNQLQINIDRKLKLNNFIKSVFKKNIQPVFSSKDKKYYGIYLYLLKHLTNMINATLKINLTDNNYSVSIDIPIDIKQQISEEHMENILLKEPKKALIVSDVTNAELVSKYLNKLNFKTEIKEIKEINKELPNFIEYDVVLIYSKTFEPILTDYLKTIKSYSNLKIVALVDSNNTLYPAKIVDEVVNLENLKEDIYFNFIELFRDDLVEKNEEVKELIQRKVKNNSKVLIADDDIANLRILKYMFKEYEIEAVTVTNGEDALKELQDKSFDMVILDSVMPKLNGYETISKIRENPKFNSTPIIIHTSFSIEESSMDKIFKLGFDTYLPKPFNKYDFKSLIERYIPEYLEPESIKYSKKKKELDRNTLKEFIAIYGDSDKMLSKYIKEKREVQAFALIDDLRDMAKKIEAIDFIRLLDTIELNLKRKHDIDSSLIYKLSNNLNELKKDIIKRLSA